MKLSCLQENLAAGISVVSRAVATKGSLPVLGNILLQTENGRLKLAATNLETGIVTWVGAKIEEGGALTVPARILAELLGSLGPGKLELDSENQILSIIAVNAKSRINGVSAEEFPALPVTQGEPILVLDPKVFTEAVSQVAFAAATDESRPVLTGVLMKTLDSTLTLTAVDGFRLSERKITLKETPKSLTFVIPARTLSEVARLVSGQADPVTIFFSEEENQVIFKTPNIEVSTRLIDGEFPDYEKIIPRAFTTEAVLSVGELTKAVRLAAIFARDSANIVKLRFLPEEVKLLLSANTLEVGENETSLDGQITGEPGEIAFNAKYLLDCLNNLEAEKLVFRLGGSLNPGLIRFENRDDFLHLVMPVRIQA